MSEAQLSLPKVGAKAMYLLTQGSRTTELRSLLVSVGRRAIARRADKRSVRK
ncbi:MAG: hypothetical protein ABH874_04400 [Methanobacteriota archaeon]